MPRQLVEVDGAKELRRILNRIGDQDLRDELKRANRSAASIVVQRALPKVPVGETGKLRRSVRALASQNSARVRAGTARVDYAAAIHWGRGTGNINYRNGRRTTARGGPIKGRPFLWNALNASRNSVARVYAKHIDNLTRKIGR